MNLIDRLNKQTKVQNITITHDGEETEFNIKPLGASDQEALLEQLGNSLPALMKIQNAVKEGKALADISGKDYLLLQTSKRHYASCVLCDGNGKRVFSNYIKMLSAFDKDVSLLDTIADRIDTEVKDTKESLEVIEKNSLNPQD